MNLIMRVDKKLQCQATLQLFQDLQLIGLCRRDVPDNPKYHPADLQGASIWRSAARYLPPAGDRTPLKLIFQVVIPVVPDRGRSRRFPLSVRYCDSCSSEVLVGVVPFTLSVTAETDCVSSSSDGTVCASCGMLSAESSEVLAVLPAPTFPLSLSSVSLSAAAFFHFPYFFRIL